MRRAPSSPATRCTRSPPTWGRASTRGCRTWACSTRSSRQAACASAKALPCLRSARRWSSTGVSAHGRAPPSPGLSSSGTRSRCARTAQGRAQCRTQRARAVGWGERAGAHPCNVRCAQRARRDAWTTPHSSRRHGTPAPCLAARLACSTGRRRASRNCARWRGHSMSSCASGSPRHCPPSSRPKSSCSSRTRSSAMPRSSDAPMQRRARSGCAPR
mmetsp:Transcript_21468/g.55263  ORF Transcript_21468/g.55263 Transcript_21468/m.55263 type:complete len:216 (+) Transcript_21468:1141-1788(+)